MNRSPYRLIGLIAVTALVVSLSVPVPQASALSVVAPGQGELIGVCWNGAVQLYWGPLPGANSNSIQRGDMYPNDPNNFWGWLAQGYDGYAYTDHDIVPGVTYSYRIKYRPETPSNIVTVTCPTPSPTPYPTPQPHLELSCAPQYTNADSGQPVIFHAYRNWSYSSQYPYYQLTWRAIGGTPSSGIGDGFTTRFTTNGIQETRLVTVTDGYRTATCTIYVRGQEPVSQLTITPSNITVDHGTVVTFHANGGVGTYGWSAPDTVPYGATGPFWGLRFDNFSSVTQVRSVTVTSGNQSRTATVWVRPRAYVTPTPAPMTPETKHLFLSEAARNVSDGAITLSASVRAKGNDTVQFVLTVRNASNLTIYNVRVTDLLPPGLSYIWHSTQVDGSVVSDALTTSGLDLGTMGAGEQRIVRFSAMVDASAVPVAGTRTLFNIGQVRGDGTDVRSSRLPVILGTAGALSAASGVKTGTADSLLIALAAALAVTGLYAIVAGSSRRPPVRLGRDLDFARSNV